MPTTSTIQTKSATPFLLSASLALTTLSQTPFASATSTYSARRRQHSTMTIGIIAASSILGAGFLTITVAYLFRRRKGRTSPRSRSSTGPSTIPILSDDIRASQAPPDVPWQSPRSSEGFSRAATRPDSLQSRALSDTSTVKTSPSSSTIPARRDRYSARVRLFAKISTPDFRLPVDQQQGLRAAPGTAHHGLRAEAAVLREEIARLIEAPPPYRPATTERGALNGVGPQTDDAVVSAAVSTCCRASRFDSPAAVLMM